jgi:methylglutaconyl-CoA hydratase
MEDAVLLKVSPQGIATISLNRGELHNALDDKMVDLLTATLQTLAEDASVRVVVLTEVISFSAGHDSAWLRKLTEFDESQQRRDAQNYPPCWKRWTTCPSPPSPGYKVRRLASVPRWSPAAMYPSACRSAVLLLRRQAGHHSGAGCPLYHACHRPACRTRYFVTAERINAGKARAWA